MRIFKAVISFIINIPGFLKASFFWFKSLPEKYINAIGAAGMVFLAAGFMLIGLESIKNYFANMMIAGMVLVSIFVLNVTLNFTRYFGGSGPTLKHRLTSSFEERRAKEEAVVIIRKDTKQLLDMGQRDKLARLIEELDSVGNYDMINGIVTKISSNFLSVSDKARLNTARYLKTLTPAIRNIENKEVYVNLNDTFLKTEEAETDKAVYFELADLMEEGFSWFIEKGMYSKPHEMIQMFNSHKAEKDVSLKKRAYWASRILKRFSSKKYVDQLVKTLRSPDPLKQKEAYFLILRLTESRMFKLFKMRIIRSVKNVDTELARELAEEIQKGKNNG